MRIGIAYLLQETNSFSPLKAKLADFHPVAGTAVLERWAGTKTEIGGFLDGLAGKPHQPVPLFAGWAITEGPIEAAEFARMRAWVAEQVAAAGKLDALLVALHGAMCAEGTDDGEGALLQEVRAIAGREAPLVLTLDLHANLTTRMIALSDAIVGYRTYPHIDMYETGCAAAALLLRMLRGEVKPVTVMRKLPLIVPAEKMTTTAGPMAEVLDLCEELGSVSPRLLAVSAFGVQPWLEVEEMGCAAVVVANQDRAFAQETAERIARCFWERRRDFEVHLIPPRDAILQALDTKGQPVIVAESSDSPTAGSPGDSADMLVALQQYAPDAPAALWIRDEAVVQQAWNARPGQQLHAALGGLYDRVNRKPVEIDGVIRSLSDGCFRLTGGYNHGMQVEMGRTAVIDIGRVTVVVSEKSAANIAPEIFRSQGVEPRDRKIVIVKSAAGFRSEYGPFAAKILLVDTPGVSSANLRRLPYRRVPRPIYPLDEVDPFPESREGRAPGRR